MAGILSISLLVKFTNSLTDPASRVIVNYRASDRYECLMVAFALYVYGIDRPLTLE